MNVIYPILSVVLISLVSVIAAVPLLIKKKVSDKILLFLLSFSVGVLLTTVFLDFLPEIFEHDFSPLKSYVILAGFMLMFILEKFIHWHHTKKCENDNCGHSHAYNLAPINLIGDAIHNFIDGLVIAGSFAVDITMGITATISIIFHEIPQEIADFGVLLYSGLSKVKAVLFNLLSALTAIIGLFVGLILIGNVEGISNMIIPFAAGNFLYIAASNLLPELHRHCKIKDTLLHILAIVLGICLVAFVITFGPAHVH
jgi:zinc and cadmium transporter